jgi:hypothetical protein
LTREIESLRADRVVLHDSISASEPKSLDPPNLSQSRIFVEKDLVPDAAAVVFETIAATEEHEDAEQVPLQGQKVAALLGAELKSERHTSSPSDLAKLSARVGARSPCASVPVLAGAAGLILAERDRYRLPTVYGDSGYRMTG